MHSLILLLMISICNVAGTGQCIERKCTLSTSQWCCFYNTTCGTNNTCNETTHAVDRSRCRGRISCTSDQSSWCCENDQRCGDYQKCNDDDSRVTLIIILCSTIGFVIFAFTCIFCLVKHHQKVDNSMARFGVRIANASAIMNSLRHSTTIRSTPFTQVFIIAPTKKSTDNIEESPPTYETATLPSTGPNRDLVGIDQD